MNYIRFSSNKSQEEIYKIIEDRFNEIGIAKVLPNGIIRINANEVSNFTLEVIVESNIKVNGDGFYFINVETDMKLSGLMWVLILCLIGLPMLIIPFMLKGTLERKIKTILSDIKLLNES